MLSFIINLLVSGLLVFVLAKILPGVSVKSYGSAVGVAIVLGLLNAFVKPILILLSLPITILTLGLFSFIITAIIILLASAIMGDKFHVDGLLYALIFGIALAIAQSIISI